MLQKINIKYTIQIYILLKQKEGDLCLKISGSRTLLDLLAVLYLNLLMSSIYPTMHIV